MNRYEAEQSKQGAPEDGMLSHEQGDANNPYAAHHQQAAPDLDASAPRLKSNDARRANRNAVSMLIALAALLALGVLWVVFSASSRNSGAPTQPRKEETVHVPEAPKTPPLPSAPPPSPPVAPQAQPIPLALPPLPPSRPQGVPAAPRGSTLVERRIAAAEGGSANNPVESPSGYANGPAKNVMPLPGYADASGVDDGTSQFRLPANIAYNAKPLAEVSNAQPLTHPDSLMLRGTYIRCVLETHIITDIPGFTSCIVSEPVYSFNGKHLLLPKGSKVLGAYSQEPNGPRVAVVWDRVVTPNGIDVNMASPGIDNLGGAGHPGHYDAHWGSRISSALLISLLSDAFKYEAAKHGPRSNSIAANGTVVEQPFESNTAQTIQQLANQAVRRSANRPATVTINQGTVLTIYVAKDVDFTGVLARY